MGSRVKTFDSTGVAPDGRLYAGDLNEIQDQYADADNLAQTIRAGILAIGETGLQLVRYASGIARITGKLRVDDKVNAIGGYQVNGEDLNSSHLSDAGTVGLPSGVIMPYGGTAAPTGFLMCDGASKLRADYADLYTAIGTHYGSVDGTHFNVPDLRGRVPVGKGASGTFATLGDDGGEETHALEMLEIPVHDHPLTANVDGDVRYRTVQQGTGGEVTVVNDVGGVSGAITGTWEELDTGNAGTNVGFSGFPYGHNNLQPYQVVNYIIKT